MLSSSRRNNRMDDDDDDMATNLFGSATEFYRLHGNISHVERQQVLQELVGTSASASMKSKSKILFATDVAARGINLPFVNWIVQYDPPTDINDYIHRAGRTARAGNAGHSLLFLLPSEQEFVNVLVEKTRKSGSNSKLSALSLSSTLYDASNLNGVSMSLVKEGQLKMGGGGGGSNTSNNSKNRQGEAFAYGLQERIEQCMVAESNDEQRLNKNKGKSGNKQRTSDLLLDLARCAYASFVRAYPTKERSIKHIFSIRALHLGHVAKSFGLKEPPSRVRSSNGDNKRKRKKEHSSQLSFSSSKAVRRSTTTDTSTTNMKQEEETKKSNKSSKHKKAKYNDDDDYSNLKKNGNNKDGEINISNRRQKMMTVAKSQATNLLEFG